jgi:hypothetical protein
MYLGGILKMSKKSLYQDVYHMATRNKGGPEGRKKTLRTLQRQNSPIAGTYAKVLKNNPHFLMKKGDTNYNYFKNKAYEKRKARRA